jgi:hypothetical protein
MMNPINSRAACFFFEGPASKNHNGGFHALEVGWMVGQMPSNRVATVDTSQFTVKSSQIELNQIRVKINRLCLATPK